MPLNKTMHALAVDDDELNLLILTKHLKRQGFETEEFMEGQQALQRLVQGPYDIDFMLLDRMMGDIDGLEIVRKIRTYPELRFTPVIIESGKVGATLFEEAYDAGASYYLVKPFNDQQMLMLCNAAKYDIYKVQQLSSLLSEGNANMSEYYNITTLADARKAIAQIASRAKDPLAVSMAIYEIVLNGFEHGCLKIAKDEKKQSILQDTWQDTLENKVAQAGCYVEMNVTQFDDAIQVDIIDMGKGFDWESYFNTFDAAVITEPFGMSLRKAQASLKTLTFNSAGNMASCLFEKNV